MCCAKNPSAFKNAAKLCCTFKPAAHSPAAQSRRLDLDVTTCMQEGMKTSKDLSKGCLQRLVIQTVYANTFTSNSLQLHYRVIEIVAYVMEAVS